MTARVPARSPGTPSLGAHYIGKPYLAGLAQGHIDSLAHMLGHQLPLVAQIAYGSSEATTDTWRIAYHASANARAVAICIVPEGYVYAGGQVNVASAETDTPVTWYVDHATIADLGDLGSPFRAMFVVPVTAGVLQELAWATTNLHLHSVCVWEIPRKELLGTEDHTDRSFPDTGRYITDNVSASDPRGFTSLLNAVLDARQAMSRHVINLPFRPGLASTPVVAPAWEYAIGSATHGVRVTARDVRGGGSTTAPIRCKVRVSAYVAGTHSVRFAFTTGGNVDITGINATGWWPGGGAVATAGQPGSCAFSDILKVLTQVDAGANPITIDSICVYEDIPPTSGVFSALDQRGLPAWLTFTRAAGNNSYQLAAAVDGTTFIVMNEVANAPRFHYVPAAGRRCLLVEPARTNLFQFSDFVDVAPANNHPDGWTLAAGVAGVDFFVDAGAPHGGNLLRIVTSGTGVFEGANAALTQYTSSAWTRPTVAVGITAYGHNLTPGSATWAEAATHDWQRKYVVATTVGAGGANIGGMYVTFGAGDTHRNACPQIEAGGTPSTWIPTTAGAATRAAERCIIGAAVMPVNSGDVSFTWIPEFASTDPYGTPQLLSWNAATYIEVTAAQTIRIVNAGLARATSAVLAWAAFDELNIRLQFGAFGTIIWINGVSVADVNAWAAPGLVNPALGTDSAGANCAPAAYADIYLSAP